PPRVDLVRLIFLMLLVRLIVAAALAFAVLDIPVIAAQEQGPQPVSGTAAPAAEDDSDPADASAPAPSSPWLLVPLVSSSPKLGTSFGAMAAYIHTFDPASRVSMFGMTYQYTSTHSSIALAFARASMGADHHRIV